jgi:hypothetical protein
LLTGVKEHSEQAIVSARRLIATLDARSTFPTVAAAIHHLQRLGILHEITGRQRHGLFTYRGYMDILNEGAEPLR